MNRTRDRRASPAATRKNADQPTGAPLMVSSAARRRDRGERAVTAITLAAAVASVVGTVAVGAALEPGARASAAPAPAPKTPLPSPAATTQAGRPSVATRSSTR